MSSHDDRHEEWLISILAGQDVGREVIAITDSCPDCKSALAEVAMLGRVLDTAGRMERAATAGTGSAGSRSGVPTLVGGSERTRNSRQSVLVRVAAAIVVLAALGTWWRTQTGEEHRGAGPNLSGSREIELVPSGVVAVVTEFRFGTELPSGGSFRVRVYDPADGDRLVLQSPPLLEPVWIPKPEELSSLPRRFRWELRVLDATEVKVAEATAQVELR